MQCHRCDRGIQSSGQETSLLADRLIHCLPVCVGDKAAPVPSQGLRRARSCACVLCNEFTLGKLGLSLKIQRGPLKFLVSHLNPKESDHQGSSEDLFYSWRKSLKLWHTLVNLKRSVDTGVTVVNMSLELFTAQVPSLFAPYIAKKKKPTHNLIFWRCELCAE